MPTWQGCLLCECDHGPYHEEQRVGADAPKKKNVKSESCVFCDHLTKCTEVSKERLEQEYRCDAFTSASETDKAARLQIVDAFGPWALWYENVNAEKTPTSVRPTVSRRRKRNG